MQVGAAWMGTMPVLACMLQCVRTCLSGPPALGLISLGKCEHTEVYLLSRTKVYPLTETQRKTGVWARVHRGSETWQGRKLQSHNVNGTACDHTRCWSAALGRKGEGKYCLDKQTWTEHMSLQTNVCVCI